MKPLNGRCAMTREERNARRRELDLNAFHRSLSRKVAKAWKDKQRDQDGDNFTAPPGGAQDRGNPGGKRPAAWRRAQGVSRTGECPSGHLRTGASGAPAPKKGSKLATRCASRAPADARFLKRKQNQC